MFAHPNGLGESRFTENIIVDELCETGEVGVFPEVNKDAIFFGEGWNIVTNMIIQDI